MSLKQIELKSVPSSRDARVGLGREFYGVDGFWSGPEMDLAHGRQTVGVPCRLFDLLAGYKYYMLEA